MLDTILSILHRFSSLIFTKAYGTNTIIISILLIWKLRPRCVGIFVPHLTTSKGQNDGWNSELLDAKPHTISQLCTVCLARREQEMVRPMYVDLQHH